jgi:hypothetical protein
MLLTCMMQIVECQQHLLNSLVKHDQGLVDGESQLGCQVIDALALQAHAAWQRRTDAGRSEAGALPGVIRTQPAGASGSAHCC